MKLGDCFTPTQLAYEIFCQHPELIAPIPILEIAKAVGIAEINPIFSEEVEGMLVADEYKSRGVIFYKSSSPLGRQRFTIGHELGHFLLLHHGCNQQCSPSDIRFNSNSSRLELLEKEANEFSQLLLMPDTLVSAAINSSPISIETLKMISDKFEMSFEAIANKCASLSINPFALVYSKDNVIRYCWRDWKKFIHHIPLKKGDALPSSSHIANMYQEEETISELADISANVWLQSRRNQPLPSKIYEQTYTQLDGYQVTILKI